MTDPIFIHGLVQIAGEDVLVIEDKAGDRPVPSVTNAAHKVLATIAKTDPIPKWVIYRDSSGAWDRIVTTEAGRFSHFSPILPGFPSPETSGEAFRLLEARIAQHHTKH